ncbi:MAG: glycoside hydrolase family 5 protein [Lachnospiraceae bacterium]|nr:glycoside hydrolase family 5 protein [Lachnospiraceae bacterium]
MTVVEQYGALRVIGNELTDKEGTPVQLRGISTSGLQWYPEYVNREFFTQMVKEWKADIVRLAMYTVEGGYCEMDEEGKKKQKEIIDLGVKLAVELGIYILIDWHILHDSNPLIHVEEAKLFWDEISKKYADCPNVLFEICNEPNEGCLWPDIHKYADTILPIIRKNAKDTIVIVGTPNWSQELDKAVVDPVTGYDNIMYALHFYADTHKQSLRDIFVQAHDMDKLPIFVTEFGAVDAAGNGVTNIDEANVWLDLLDARKISYCIWNLSNRDESSAFFKPEVTKVSGFTKDDLRTQALWYLDRLAK